MRVGCCDTKLFSIPGMKKIRTTNNPKNSPGPVSKSYFKNDDYIRTDFEQAVYNHYNGLGQTDHREFESKYAAVAIPKDVSKGLPTMYMDLKTGERKKFYQGKSMEEWCRELPPQKDSLTGCTFFYIGGETYVPEREKDRLHRRLAELSKELNLPEYEVYNRSDMGHTRVLPDGTEITILRNGKIRIDSPGKESLFFHCNVSGNLYEFLNEMFQKIKNNKNIFAKPWLQEKFWNK